MSRTEGNGMTKNNFIDQDRSLIACPVCGSPVELDDICGICNWQNTGLYNIDGGPNKMTLAEAIEAFSKGGPII